MGCKSLPTKPEPAGSDMPTKITGRRAIELSLGEADLEKLRLMAQSRTPQAPPKTYFFASTGSMDYFNDNPVVHTWTYKLDKAA
jgi:hypothetical protein